MLYSLAALAIGCVYSIPNPEVLDLCSEGRMQGVLNSVVSLLLNYDGRFTTNLLHVLHPFAYGGAALYGCYNFCSILLLVVSAYVFFSTYVFAGRLKTLFFSVLYSCVHFAISPELSTELYTLTASFVYLYGCCFWLLWISTLKPYLLEENSPQNVFIHYLISSIFLVLSIGTNEQMIPINAATLLLVGFYIFNHSRSSFKRFIPLALNGSLAIVFFITCPGWHERYQGQGQVTEYTLHLVQTSVVDCVILFIKRLPIHAFLFILFMLSLLVHKDKTFTLRHPYPYLFASLVLLMLVCIVNVLIYVIGLNNWHQVPERIFTVNANVVQIFLIVATMLTINVTKNLWSYSPLVISVVLLYVVVFGKTNYQRIYQEFRSGVYLAQKKSFDHLITEAERQKQKPGYWKSVSMAYYPTEDNTIYYSLTFPPNRMNANANEGIEKYFEIDEFHFSNDTARKLKETYQ